MFLQKKLKMKTMIFQLVVFLIWCGEFSSISDLSSILSFILKTLLTFFIAFWKRDGKKASSDVGFNRLFWWFLFVQLTARHQACRKSPLTAEYRDDWYSKRRLSRFWHSLSPRDFILSNNWSSFQTKRTSSNHELNDRILLLRGLG